MAWSSAGDGHAAAVCRAIAKSFGCHHARFHGCRSKPDSIERASGFLIAHGLNSYLLVRSEGDLFSQLRTLITRLRRLLPIRCDDMDALCAAIGKISGAPDAIVVIGAPSENGGVYTSVSLLRSFADVARGEILKRVAEFEMDESLSGLRDTKELNLSGGNHLASVGMDHRVLSPVVGRGISTDFKSNGKAVTIATRTALDEVAVLYTETEFINAVRHALQPHQELMSLSKA